MPTPGLQHTFELPQKTCYLYTNGGWTSLVMYMHKVASVTINFYMWPLFFHVYFCATPDSRFKIFRTPIFTSRHHDIYFGKSLPAVSTLSNTTSSFLRRQVTYHTVECSSVSVFVASCYLSCTHIIELITFYIWPFLFNSPFKSFHDKLSPVHEIVHRCQKCLVGDDTNLNSAYELHIKWIIRTGYMLWKGENILKKRSFDYYWKISTWEFWGQCILIYQGVYCCTKVCNLHLDDSLSKSRDNRMHWTRCNLLKWKGIYKNYEPFTDQLQPIYFTCNDL